MSADVLLKVDDLRVHFHGAHSYQLRHPAGTVRALDGVSFTLASGETLGIVGESGCGKSTLCRAVLRLIRPTGGRVIWCGRNLADLDREELRLQRRYMQIIFQDPFSSLNPRMTVRRILEEPLRNFPETCPSGERAARIGRMLQLVGGSAEWADRFPHEFSGGQCQRIGIARALMLNPRLLVCDEPVSALDVSVQAQIINLLADLQGRLQLSYLFVSHNLAVVRHISRRVMVLYLGKIVELADSDALYERPLHPYTQALIGAVPTPSPEHERGKRRVRLEGELASSTPGSTGCPLYARCPKASAVCAAIEPALVEYGQGHLAACHHIESNTF